MTSPFLAGNRRLPLTNVVGNVGFWPNHHTMPRSPALAWSGESLAWGIGAYAWSHWACMVKTSSAYLPYLGTVMIPKLNFPASPGPHLNPFIYHDPSSPFSPSIVSVPLPPSSVTPCPFSFHFLLSIPSTRAQADNNLAL